MGVLGSEPAKPLEPDLETVTVGQIALARREVERYPVEASQEFEHRAIFVLEQPARNVNNVIKRDANEALIERPVVD